MYLSSIEMMIRMILAYYFLTSLIEMIFVELDNLKYITTIDMFITLNFSNNFVRTLYIKH